METTLENNFYHIFFTGNNNQVIFYDDEDFIQCINRLALAANATSTSVMAYIFHNNHIHLLIKTSNVTRFMHYFRKSVTAWFHKRYQSKGSVGQRGFGRCTLYSDEDLIDIVKYILRNEVRHSISRNPFNAKWSSIGCYFKEADARYSKNADLKFVSRYIPARKELPKRFIMGADGLIDPCSFVEKSIVKQLFISQSKFRKEMKILSGREERVIAKENFDEMKKEFDYFNSPQFTAPVKDSVLLDFMTDYIQKQLDDDNILNLTNGNLINLHLDNKYELAAVSKNIFKGVTFKQLSRVLAVPSSTLWKHLYPSPK